MTAYAFLDMSQAAASGFKSTDTLDLSTVFLATLNPVYDDLGNIRLTPTLNISWHPAAPGGGGPGNSRNLVFPADALSAASLSGGVTGGAGYAATTRDLFGTTRDDSLTGAGADDWANAGPGHDVVYGGGGGDVLAGNDGNDHIWGNASTAVQGMADGADSIDGGAGNDYIHGNAGDDTIQGGAGNDRIRGGQGNDLLYGGAPDGSMDGDDTIQGDRGDDILLGGGGRDLLSGGEGRDIFLFGRIDFGSGVVVAGGGDAPAGTERVETITDFENGADRISLGGAVFSFADGPDRGFHYNGLPVSVLTGDAFTTAKAALDYAQSLLDRAADVAGRHEVAAIAVGGDTWLFSVEGGGATIDTAIRLIGINPSAIDAADFI
ncbi:calcium-binding protein [Sphingomonas quercus]|uniref:Calcium-binding protein n=1 Tax=Sphingomonas quercus TaxID=2842451 RepID=A0ABS6BFZ7_9SPHN|nr:hypothetical protein [Sphingomonas quercus]MBU3076507.1 hypothetical protein [Sphingomonas quercus]